MDLVRKSSKNLTLSICNSDGIHHYNKDNDTFQLDFPNFEVEESFKKFIVTTLSGISPFNLETLASQLLNTIKSNDMQTFARF